jgi:hypothetical protein
MYRENQKIHLEAVQAVTGLDDNGWLELQHDIAEGFLQTKGGRFQSLITDPGFAQWFRRQFARLTSMFFERITPDADAFWYDEIDKQVLRGAETGSDVQILLKDHAATVLSHKNVDITFDYHFKEAGNEMYNFVKV